MMNTSPNTLNTVLKYLLCLYILLGSFIHTKFHLSKRNIKAITICMIASIFLTILYDAPLSLLFCIASMVFVMTYVKKSFDNNKIQNELFEQIQVKTLTPNKIHDNEKEIAETHPKQIVNDEKKNIVISRSCNVNTYNIHDNFDITQPHLEHVQTNVFDKLNYDIYLNELKVEHYNTQGINEQEPDVNGYDPEIFLH